MKTTRVPAERCIGCGEENDTASNIDQQTPSPGDLSICIKCGYLSIFTKDLRHRPLTVKELEEASADPRIQIIQMVRRHVIKNPDA
jgi:hypothetical protein